MSVVFRHINRYTKHNLMKRRGAVTFSRIRIKSNSLEDFKEQIFSADEEGTFCGLRVPHMLPNAR